MRSGPGAARTILLFRIISARPPKQPLFFFSRSLGRRVHLGVEVTESSTNKQHLSLTCGVPWFLGSFLETRASGSDAHRVLCLLCKRAQPQLPPHDTTGGRALQLSRIN